METFGERLSREIKIKNLTPAKVAQLMNLKARQNIYNWINGISKPHADDLAKLATVLNVSIDYLLLGIEPPPIFNPQEKTISINQEEYIQFLNWKSQALEKENERLRKQNFEDVSK